MLTDLNQAELAAKERDLANRLATLKRVNLSLDLTRGKPSPEQLALSDQVEFMTGNDFKTEDGADARNYGGLSGIAEARQLGAQLLGVDAGNVIAGGNSSLTLMYQYLLHAWLNGTTGPETAWRHEGEQLKFLCIVPGYDRHFKITESLGFELINIGFTAEGPDMDQIETLVDNDPLIKGIWCVPKYSNPTGHVYSDTVVERMALLAKRAGMNFRIMWDNAYAVHDLTSDPPPLLNLMEQCQAVGTEDSAILFASTSKVTRAGSGISFIAASTCNLVSFRRSLGVQTIGPDKVNQLRHVRFLKNLGGINELMQRHAAIVRPKFDRVVKHLRDGLSANGVGMWTVPQGGYFISFESPPGLASAIVQLAGETGVKLTPAGATFPYGRHPNDSNIRLAPTFPTLAEIDQAMPVFVTAVTLAAVRQQLGMIIKVP